MALLGRVAALTRHPVKSLGGEQVRHLEVDGRGVVGDRWWAACTEDGGLGSGKDTRRFRRVDGLLDWSAATTGTATILTAPDGRTYVAGEPDADEALSRWTGRRLVLRTEGATSHLDESPVHLVAASSLHHVAALVGGGRLDPARVRANVLVETDATDDPADPGGFVEDAWAGRQVRVGGVVLALGPGMVRCRMVDLAPTGAAAGPPVLRALGRHHDVRLGLTATVVEPGTVRVGDELRTVGGD